MAVGFRISIEEREEMSHGKTSRGSNEAEVVGIVGRADF